MRRKSLTPLGETEMEILHHVWDLRQATVADVRARILETREVAYTTVMTVMKNLADKGYLQFEKDGVTYVYSAARPPEEVRHSLVDDLVRKVFDGSPLALVQTLVRAENLTEAERQDLKRLIDEMEDDDDA
ncbi:MAG TPA: BlaI/MecI/CopY family transcriptional regulator [Rhodothermales bacterium]|nr:BlaI/MecI/CopY family transcriptional regulator [Rhodothermales bacterium]